MSRHIQVTFDAHDPRALSSFWRDALGYVHPGPPGVGLPADADPLAAWDDFLARVGVPHEQRNTRSAIEDPGIRATAPYMLTWASVGQSRVASSTRQRRAGGVRGCERGEAG